jgi:signal transduction histidine kinase
MIGAGNEQERRVLVMARAARDAELTCELLAKAAFPCASCSDSADLTRELERGAGLVVVAEEALENSSFEALIGALSNEPRWSDVPFIVLTNGGHRTGRGRRRAQDLERLGHVTLLERPVRTGTLMSAVRAAWRSRQRQYEVRDYLADRERAEQALIEQADRLARANADLEQFAYVTSHDLQEPLRSIASFAQMLARKYRGRLDADADEFIQYITQGVERMRAVIEDLLAYSRLVHQPAVPFQPVALRSVVEWARENLRRSVEDSGATICSRYLPVVLGDRVELVALFQNLLSNAIKYRRPGTLPVVEIGAERRGSEWLVSVSDNGSGFEPGYSDKIFELFRRLHGRDIPGTGLGLTICRKVVERHGGKIWAESQGCGQGATFYFTLPDAQAATAD